MFGAADLMGLDDNEIMDGVGCCGRKGKDDRRVYGRVGMARASFVSMKILRTAALAI